MYIALSEVLNIFWELLHEVRCFGRQWLIARCMLVLLLRVLVLKTDAKEMCCFLYPGVFPPSNECTVP